MSDWLKQEETLNTDIDVLELGKLSSNKNIGYSEKEYYEWNQIDMSDDKEYY